MLRYGVHQFFLESVGRYLLPLPKLGSEHLRAIAEHLARNRFEVSVGRTLRARWREQRISVDPSGLASSNVSLLDALAPCIPDLLREEKVRVDLNPYFVIKKAADSFYVQVFTRMEGRRIWKELRRIGECALTPDEHHLIQALLAHSVGRVNAVTDFPTETGVQFRVGRRNYFNSVLDVKEFASSLRVMGKMGQKNSYLPVNSILILSGLVVPSGHAVRLAFDELGEWCLLTLHSDKNP
jgi:hypothetical protein